jgi:hypothetical protein
MTVTAAKTHRFTAEDYHRMGEAGVLPPDGRFELIRGEIVEMSPIGSAHAAVVRRLARILHEQVGEQAIVDVQNPLRLDQWSEPQPDLALLRPRADDYYQRLPEAVDCLLVIEVADTTLAHDRETKLPLYGAAGVAEAWLIDLVGHTLERHTTPSASGFRDCHQALPPETVAAGSVAGVSLDLQGLFPE